MSSAKVTSVRPQERPMQFTLRHLIVLTIWCAVGLAIATQFGQDTELGLFLFWLLTCVAAIAYGIHQRRRGFWIAGLVGCVLPGCLFPLLPTLGPHPQAARRSQCSSNLMQIALGLQNYHDTHGTFPPAYFADKSGRPMHSWRVLILPFCEQKNLYDQYDFNEPWNGPNNSKLAKQFSTPPYLLCPSDPNDQKRGETSYLAVIGPGTVWPGEKSVAMSLITDGTSNTLLVVEVHNSGIHWMEPRDLHVSQMPLAVNPPRGQGMSSSHGVKPGSGANAVFVDAHRQFLPNDLPPETLRALLTIAGGETVQLP